MKHYNVYDLIQEIRIIIILIVGIIPLTIYSIKLLIDKIRKEKENV